MHFFLVWYFSLPFSPFFNIWPLFPFPYNSSTKDNTTSSFGARVTLQRYTAKESSPGSILNPSIRDSPSCSESAIPYKYLYKCVLAFLLILHFCFRYILGWCWGPMSRVSHPDMPALGTLVAPFNHNHCILYFQLRQSPNIEAEICIEEKSIWCCFQLIIGRFQINLRYCSLYYSLPWNVSSRTSKLT